ncbi:MAG: phosphatase PAP2 family protein [Anaerolineae bacterium]
MKEFLESLVPWGTEALVRVQSLSSEWMVLVFAALSFLGREEFYILLLPLVYWCIDRRIGIGLGYISLLSAWLNNAVKYLFDIPRPADPRLVVDYPESTPSFPSGHAQNAVANWGYLALRFRKPAVTIGAITLIVLIGLSRLVLGVHFPQDIVGGWLIGLLLLGAYTWAEPRVTPWVAAQRRSVQLALALAVPLLLFFVYPADTTGRYPAQEGVTAAGTLLGFNLGLFMERIWVRFTVAGSLGRRALRLLAGLVVLMIFYVGPRLVLPEEMTPYGLEAGVRVLRYALVGWVAAFLCPWLFLRLGLADREPEAA